MSRVKRIVIFQHDSFQRFDQADNCECTDLASIVPEAESTYDKSFSSSVGGTVVHASEALVIIDMQYDFIEKAPAGFMSGLVPKIAECISAARRMRVPIVHVATEYLHDKSNWPKAWILREKLWCMKGTRGAQIVEGLNPAGDEKTVMKSRFSAFYETELDQWITSNGVERIALVGYSADVCVRMTAIDAYNRGLPFTILTDCVLAERRATDEAVDYLRWLTNCETMRSTDWLSGLASAANRDWE